MNNEKNVVVESVYTQGEGETIGEKKPNVDIPEVPIDLDKINLDYDNKRPINIMKEIRKEVTDGNKITKQILENINPEAKKPSPQQEKQTSRDENNLGLDL